MRLTSSEIASKGFNFPAFGRGLSLRPEPKEPLKKVAGFPRLRAGTFIEANGRGKQAPGGTPFPRLRAGTFIEARLSVEEDQMNDLISPPSGGDFH